MIDKLLNSYIGKARKHVYINVLCNVLRLLSVIVFSGGLALLLAGMFAAPVPALLAGLSRNELLLILVCCIFWRALFQKLSTKASVRIVAEVKQNMRRALLEKSFKLGSSYRSHISSAELISLGSEAVDQLENYFGSYLIQFYYCLLAPLLLGCALAFCHWPSALIMTVAAFLIPLALQMMLRKVKSVQRDYWRSYMNVGKLFLDSLEGLTTLKIFGADIRRAEEIADYSEQFRLETMKLLRNQLSSICFIDWIAYGGMAAGMIVAATSGAQGGVGAWGLFCIVLLALEFFLPLKQLTSQFHVAMTGVAASEKIKAFLAAPEHRGGGKELLSVEKGITIKNLNFAYPDGTEALRDVSLEIGARGVTALVGVSGCGKSSLSNLLAAELLPPENSIYFGATEFYQLQREEFVRQITRVTHDGHIFAGTVRAYLAMAGEGLNEERMWEVLRAVRLEERFRAEQGLDSMLLSGGTNLSGGERQRLCLALALLHDSAVYIFDEVNSNVDMESEDIILDIIYGLAQTKAVIYISHRLRTVEAAEQIVVLDAGRVVECGSHADLLQRKGHYVGLRQEQLELEEFADKLRQAALVLPGGVAVHAESLRREGQL